MCREVHWSVSEGAMGGIFTSALNDIPSRNFVVNFLTIGEGECIYEIQCRG